MTTSETSRCVAAVDIGSNTIHLIIAEVGAGGRRLAIRDRIVELARLGADVAATGAIGPERAARVCAALRKMAERARQAGALTVLGLATEGVRAASNAPEMITQFSAALGAPIALINGMEEAALTFWGATSSVADDNLLLGVGDLGGGSCELVTGTQAQITSATSIKLGSGRLIDTVKPADPPTPEDFAHLTEQARQAMQTVPPPAQPLPQVIAVGGAATALARFAGQRNDLDRADLQRAQDLLGAQPVAALAPRTGIDTERLRLITGGVIAWQAIMDHLGAQRLAVSERGVREGAVIAWAHAGADWLHYAREAVAGL